MNPETYPVWGAVVYQFPARGDMPPVKLTWYEGEKDGKLVLPPRTCCQGQAWARKLPGSGSILVGDKGMLYSPNDYGGELHLLPEEVREGYRKPEKTCRATAAATAARRGVGRGHQGRQAAIAMSNFDYAGMLTETILLGNVAMRAGKKLEWDGPSLKITNVPEADKYLQTEYRKGWTL